MRLHEHEVQQAASRGRVERTLSDLQRKLDGYEAEQIERRARLDHFDSMRFTKKKEMQEIATRHCIERANLANSMDRMRSNMKNGSSAYAMPPAFRRGLQSNPNPNPNPNPYPRPHPHPHPHPHPNPHPYPYHYPYPYPCPYP